MSKLSIIDSILHEKFKDNSDCLIEKDKDSKGKIFEMKRKIIIPKGINTSLYKYDSKIEILPFFKSKGVTKLKKICDYILFIEEKAHLFIYLIEMKKGRESAKNQLEASQCFAEYIISTINRLNLNLEISSANLHFRKIRISESKSMKATLKKNIEENEHGIIDHKHPQCFYIKEYLTY
jgi:hypothetical protein